MTKITVFTENHGKSRKWHFFGPVYGPLFGDFALFSFQNPIQTQRVVPKWPKPWKPWKTVKNSDFHDFLSKPLSNPRGFCHFDTFWHHWTTTGLVDRTGAPQPLSKPRGKVPFWPFLTKNCTKCSGQNDTFRLKTLSKPRGFWQNHCFWSKSLFLV